MAERNGRSGESYGEVAVDELVDHLEDLEGTVDSHEEQQAVRRAVRMAQHLAVDGVLGERIRKYTTRDMAEAFVGALIFAVPLLVEDGVFDIAGHFVGTAPLGVPVFFVGNVALIVLMAAGLIYWANIQRVEIATRPFGVPVPRRLIGVLVIAFLTAATMMTLWGRVNGWADPRVAVARISVVWTVSTFGAALGDILPGESAGQDINELVEDLDFVD